MMKCDLRLGYCRDGRLPCNLCDCFLPIKRTPISRLIGRPGQLAYSALLERVKVRSVKRLKVISITKNTSNNLPLSGVSLETSIDVGSVEDQSTNQRHDPVSGVKVKGIINGFLQLAKEVVCRQIGHDWETYAYATGYFSYDVEQAGHCKRCGFDTHS